MERLATKVAELKQTQRMAIYGTVKPTGVASVTVETKTKNLKIELTDDIKVIQDVSGKRTALNTDDIDQGDSVVIFGEFDATLDLMRAKVIFIQSKLPQNIAGLVSTTDAKNFTFSIKDPLGTEILIDFEKNTRANEWNGGSDIAKSGFSKIKTGNLVYISGYPVPNKTNRFSASRILILPGSAVPEETATPKVTLIPTAKPTGKILPTAKATIGPTEIPAP